MGYVNVDGLFKDYNGSTSVVVDSKLGRIKLWHSQRYLSKKQGKQERIDYNLWWQAHKRIIYQSAVSDHWINVILEVPIALQARTELIPNLDWKPATVSQ